MPAKKLFKKAAKAAIAQALDTLRINLVLAGLNADLQRLAKILVEERPELIPRLREALGHLAAIHNAFNAPTNKKP